MYSLRVQLPLHWRKVENGLCIGFVQDVKDAAESAEGSMTAGQKARLEEKFAANESLLHHGGSIGIAKDLNGLGDEKVVRASEVSLWWERKRQKASKKRRLQDVKDAAESAEGSMTAGQKTRLEEKFAANESLLHHGGSLGIARIRNSLGDHKMVRASEVALWWDRKRHEVSKMETGR